MESHDLELKLDEMRQLKTERQRQIEADFNSGRIDLQHTLLELTNLADHFLRACAQLAQLEMRRSYGIPEYQGAAGQFLPGEWAIIGMGKLGGQELHFGSDLDLLFIFNRHGKTRGAKEISSQEYFAKLAQRLISYMGLYTRYGYLYKIDTELRPSGNAGTLVTDLHSWITYYHEMAALWEHQALLKARLIMATGAFAQDFQGLFRRLIFLKPFPPNMAEEIHHLRIRIEKELAKETDRRWHYKKGYGGLVDIEFAVQYLQLKLGKVFDSLLHPNTLEALRALGARVILKPEVMACFEQAYHFYRRLEIILEIRFLLKDGYLDTDYERLDEVSQAMDFANPQAFLEVFRSHRLRVRENYLNILQQGK